MLIVVEAATSELVDLDRLKLHCRVDADDEDEILQAYLDAASAYCASYTGLTFAPTTYEERFDGWNHPCGLRLGTAPARDVEAVRYVDSSGILQTLDAGSWDVFPTGLGAIVRTTSAPSLSEQPGAVRVEYAAGFNDPADSGSDPAWAAPRQAAQAILLLAGHWYANRETVTIGASPANVPFATEALLNQIRVYR